MTRLESRPTDRRQSLSRPAAGRLLVVDGPRPWLAGAPSRAVSIGSGDGDDLIVRARGVRPGHCRLDPLPGGGHRVVDRAGAGLHVEGRRVTEAVLEPLDRVMVGSAVITYLGGLQATDPLELELDGGSRPARLTRLVLGLQETPSEADELGAWLAPLLDDLLAWSGFERGLLVLLPGARSSDRRLQALASRRVEPATLQAILGTAGALVERAQAAGAVVRGTSPLGGPGATLCCPLPPPGAQGGPERRVRRGPPRGALLLGESRPRDEVAPEVPVLLAAVLRRVAALLNESRRRPEGSLDPLTGLLSRASIEQALADEVRGANDGERGLGLLLLDVDDFKRVNEEHGRPAGDELLRALAERVRGTIRGDDLAGRWGGEQILVLAPETDRAGAVALSERLLEAIAREPFGPAGLRVTASAGVVVVPWHGREPQDLLRRADLALYAAKRGGKGRVQAYEPELDTTGAGEPGPGPEPVAWLSSPLLGDMGLRPGTTWIGRNSACGIVLPHDSVSRWHALLEVDAGGAVAFEDRSRNGSQVNGRPVSGRVTLSPGDRLAIGPFRLELCRARRAEAIETSHRGTLAGRTTRFERVLDVLERSRASGVLELRGSEAEGRIELLEGRVRAAQVGEAQGGDALAAVRSGAAGGGCYSFRLAPGHDPTLAAAVAVLLAGEEGEERSATLARGTAILPAAAEMVWDVLDGPAPSAASRG